MLILLNIFLIVSINNEEKRLISSVLDNLHYYASVAEGFGLSVLEALNKKVPVICFDILPLNKMVINNKNGLLVEPFNLYSFQEKLLLLIKNNFPLVTNF